MFASCLLLALAALPAQAPDSQERTLVIYRVDDLCEWRESEAEAEARLVGSFEEPLMDPEFVPHLVEAVRFATLLRERMAPAFDASKDQLIPLEAGNLVALLRPAQHEWLAALLERQRASRLNLLLDAVILTGPESAFRERKLQRTTGWPEPVPVFAELDAIAELLEELRADDGFEELNHLKLVTFERQRASMVVGSSISYVKDYELVTVEPDGESLADPVIGVLHEGLRLQVMGLELTPGQVSLELDFIAREVERPIPTVDLTLPGTEQPVTVALPSTTQVSFASQLTLPDTQGAYFILDGTTKGEWMAIFVSVKGIR